uniref:Pectinesterase inhibitor domain-containing protein n=1 Tax=Ananas comosus var. bracteatus TaxID=296719 RepID=A0A6V7QQH8_ANACO|nr:unnamed protein product [Ananas comosus var. bracteatus]
MYTCCISLSYSVVQTFQRTPSPSIPSVVSPPRNLLLRRPFLPREHVPARRNCPPRHRLRLLRAITPIRQRKPYGAADLAALAVVAARIANATAAGTESRIKCMIESELNPSKRDRLGVCDEVYSDAIDRIGDAVRSIEAGLYSDAVTFLSAALDASENCEDSFREGAEEDGSAAAPPSPLEREDGEYERLAEMALAITAWLVFVL